MSGPESGIALGCCPADIVELAAFREGAADLARAAAGHGLTLPGSGAVVARSGRLTLSVRPGRWLLLAPPAAAGESAAFWQEASGGRHAAVIDLSSALVGFLLRGPAVPEMLARGCRLDLEANAFPAGRAAATILVQVPAILARLTPGMLREWLVETSRPFGLALAADATVSELCGESST